MADSTSQQGTGTTTTATPTAPVPAVGTRLSAEEIHENVREAAESEMRRSAWALFWSALAAGLTISFSFLAGGYLATLVPDALRPAAAAAGYPLGFIFVVLARSQLFTENTLEPIIPLLNTPSLGMLGRVLRLWVIVLVGNLLGALVIAWALARSPVVDAALMQSLGRLAAASTSGGFVTVFYRAIFAGWLVALMAWLVASTSLTGAQIALIWLTTAPIAAFGFRHSIAGAVEAFYRVGAGSASWSAMVVGFIVPAVLGNIVGGALLVGLVNHGQVAADRTFEESWERRWASGASPPRGRWRGRSGRHGRRTDIPAGTASPESRCECREARLENDTAHRGGVGSARCGVSFSLLVARSSQLASGLAVAAGMPARHTRRLPNGDPALRAGVTFLRGPAVSAV